MEKCQVYVENFSKLTNQPEKFLSVQAKAAENLTEVTRDLYDVSKEDIASEAEETDTQTLPNLIVDGFDDEQIWQQIELQNEHVVSKLLSQLSKLATGERVSFEVKECAVPATKRPEKKKLRKKKKDKQVHFEGSSSSEEEEATSTKGSNVRKNKGSVLVDANEEVLIDQRSEDDEEDNELNDFLKRGLADAGDSGSEEERMLQDLLDRATAEADDNDQDQNSDNDGDDFDLFAGEAEEDQLDFDFDKPKLQQRNKKDKLESDRDLSNLDKSDRTGFQFGQSKKKTKRKTEVDDKFFKLADMEEFLDIEDAKEDKKRSQGEQDESEGEGSEEDIDMFQDIPSENEDGDDDLKYADFFDPPDDENQIANSRPANDDQGKENDDSDNFINDSEVEIENVGGDSENDAEGSEDEDSQNIDEEEGEENEEIGGGRRDLLADSESEGEDVRDILGRSDKSSYQKRKEKLREKIGAMEDAAVAEKPWQLGGETQGATRPMNSLLEHDLEFEQQSKAAPLITEETTKTIEEIIIQRIKDKAFDDVVRKVKPKESAYEYKKRIELDQEKSKLSLGQIYEQEYLQQQEEKEEETVDPEREEIKHSMTSLFQKLDALCNFHFTPKPAMPDVEIVNNLPAITVEEVQPTTETERTTLAPEELHEKKKWELKGTTERTRTDKLRARRDKKMRQRAKQKRQVEREALLSVNNPKLAKKLAQDKAMEDLTKQSKRGRGVTMVQEKGKGENLTSSTKFFAQLQDEVTTHVRASKAKNTKNKRLQQRSVAKLKL